MTKGTIKDTIRNGVLNGTLIMDDALVFANEWY